MATDQETAHQPHESHGNSVAAWTAVGIVLIGFFVMSIAVVVTALWMFVAGAILVVLGGLAGKVLGAMGFGSKARVVR